jgi:ParB family chromosome partitioning protein
MRMDSISAQPPNQKPPKRSPNKPRMFAISCHLKPELLWDWALEQPQNVLLKVLAVAVAHIINAVQSPYDDASTGRLAAAEALARALTFNMANWWQPTAANYFARIKKDQILQAIQEATGTPVKERLRSLKKQDMAAEAEKSVTGTRWLPELLRK